MESQSVSGTLENKQPIVRMITTTKLLFSSFPWYIFVFFYVLKVITTLNTIDRPDVSLGFQQSVRLASSAEAE